MGYRSDVRMLIHGSAERIGRLIDSFRKVYPENRRGGEASDTHEAARETLGRSS